ncbi:MAG: helix-turn-helix transcriptional regulator [Bacteroidales bacterium]|jgi:AraC-like DNA-binding protein|nr:helix-turn-helix transcriptional regulator [Bacteroidales bacterium]
MIVASFTLAHPLEEFRQLSEYLGGEIERNKWSYDNCFIKGYTEFYELSEGLFLYIYETYAQQKIMVNRLPNLDETYFIINFDISGIDISVDSGIPINTYGSAVFDGIFLASSQIKASFIWPLTKQTGAKIIIHKKWIEQFFCFNHDKNLPIIQYLMNQNKPVYLFEYMDSKSLSIVKEIFNIKLSPDFLKIKLLTCTLQLIEVFFSRINDREQTTYQKFHHTDLDKIFNAQQKLILDFSKPYLSIKELADIAGMSISKFQKLFKQVFGQSVYQNYQSLRMRQALHLLETSKMNIFEVSIQVGYKHAGKFSEAFYKQFGYQPNEAKKNITNKNI